MWNISHPDLVSIEEYNKYDQIFIASDKWAKELKTKLKVPVESLLQCTDPELFYPELSEEYKHDLLFVGNSRNVFRKIVRDLLSTDKNFGLYGMYWDQFIDKEYINGDHIPNTELHKAYSSCKILLNDHWDDMAEKGFISNRLFDGFAAGAFIISDEINGAEKIFGDALVTYSNSDELNKLMDYYLNNDLERIKKVEKARKIVLTYHTFAKRVECILECISKEKLNTNSKSDFYEIENLNNRSLTQKIVSKFPYLYILLNINETGFKNALTNIKGYNTIKKNHLFDSGFYLKTYPNVRHSGMDPILHYMYHGFEEGKKPNSTFDGDYYLKKHKDVKKSNLNPLVHYGLYGIKEGRKTYKP